MNRHPVLFAAAVIAAPLAAATLSAPANAQASLARSTISATSATTPSAAVRRPCPRDRWCLYQHPNYGGAYYFARDSDRDLRNNRMSDGRAVTTRSSSGWNNRINRFVRFYYGRFYGEPHVCLRPGTGIRDFRPYGIDNHVYSVNVSTHRCGAHEASPS